MKKEEKIKVIIVDDHQIFRDGIHSILTQDEGIDVIAVASDGDELINILKSNTAEVVILDISMPGKSGIELVKTLKESSPSPKTLILSMHTQDEYVYSAINAGANGFLAKQFTSAAELGDAVRKLNKGEEYYSASVLNIIKNNYLKAVNGETSKTENVVNLLTKREEEILQLVVEGHSNSEIADKLFITIRTVETHKTNILQKLNLKNSVELVRYAIRNKLVRF